MGVSKSVDSYRVKVNDNNFEEVAGIGENITEIEKVLKKEVDTIDTVASISGQDTLELNTSLQNNITV